MSGSRLGRARVGRLALLGCAGISIVFLVFLYRTTSAEMARLRDLHVKCVQKQEALAANLQVIYEYKIQLEKSLSSEKSANAAVKEELQQKASRERSLRDKDKDEASQRYNSLQQTHKQLQAEYQDFKDDCKKKEDVARENSKTLETTLQELRIQLKKAAKDKEESMENLKTKYLEVVNEKEQLEEKYNNLKKTTGDNNGNVERLQKQVIQLQRELDETKKFPHFSVGGLRLESSQVQPRHAAHLNDDGNDINNDVDNEKSAVLENNQMQMIGPSSQQQVSRPSNELQAGQNPQPLQAPQNNRHLDDTEINDNNSDKNDNNKNDDSLPNELKSDIRFENRNGNIVPVGPNDARDQYALPIPYERQDKQSDEQPLPQKTPKKVNPNEVEEDAEQQKQVLAPPNDADNTDVKSMKNDDKNSLSSKGPMMVPILGSQVVGQSMLNKNKLNAAVDDNNLD